MTGSSFSSLVISEIADILETPLPTGYRFDNCRTEPCLIITFKGSISYYYNGRRYISDSNHPLFIPKGAKYYLIVDKESNSIVLKFNCTSDYYSEYMERCTGNYGPQAIRAKYLWTFQQSTCFYPILSIIYEILSAFKNPDHEYTPHTRFQRIQPSINYLEEHFADSDLSNEQLAAASGVSTVYFRKLFTEKYGVSPQRYVRTLRIETAKDLLREHETLSISQIAEMVGYDSIYHFSRIFKQETMQTPSEYAKKFRL